MATSPQAAFPRLLPFHSIIAGDGVHDAAAQRVHTELRHELRVPGARRKRKRTLEVWIFGKCLRDYIDAKGAKTSLLRVDLVVRTHKHSDHMHSTATPSLWRRRVN